MVVEKNKNDFKIVKILDEYTVVINAGTSHDIRNKDSFQILDKKGSVVKDPDTNEIIGRLDLIKATVHVSEVHEKICICSTGHYTKLNKSLFDGLDTLVSAQTFTEREKLNIDLKEATGGLRKSNEKIRIGDTVRLIRATK